MYGAQRRLLAEQVTAGCQAVEAVDSRGGGDLRVQQRVHRIVEYPVAVVVQKQLDRHVGQRQIVGRETVARQIVEHGPDNGQQVAVFARFESQPPRFRPTTCRLATPTAEPLPQENAGLRQRSCIVPFSHGPSRHGPSRHGRCRPFPVSEKLPRPTTPTSMTRQQNKLLDTVAASLKAKAYGAGMPGRPRIFIRIFANYPVFMIIYIASITSNWPKVQGGNLWAAGGVQHRICPLLAHPGHEIVMSGGRRMEGKQSSNPFLVLQRHVFSVVV